MSKISDMQWMIARKRSVRAQNKANKLLGLYENKYLPFREEVDFQNIISLLPWLKKVERAKSKKRVVRMLGRRYGCSWQDSPEYSFFERILTGELLKIKSVLVEQMAKKYGVWCIKMKGLEEKDVSHVSGCGILAMFAEYFHYYCFPTTEANIRFFQKGVLVRWVERLKDLQESGQLAKNFSEEICAETGITEYSGHPYYFAPAFSTPEKFQHMIVFDMCPDKISCLPQFQRKVDPRNSNLPWDADDFFFQLFFVYGSDILNDRVRLYMGDSDYVLMQGFEREGYVKILSHALVENKNFSSDDFQSPFRLPALVYTTKERL